MKQTLRNASWLVAIVMILLADGVSPGSRAVAGEAGAENPLVGTSWRLVEFQSMDEAAATRRPDDPWLVHHASERRRHGEHAPQLQSRQRDLDDRTERRSRERPLRVRSARDDQGPVPAAEHGRADHSTGRVHPGLPFEGRQTLPEPHGRRRHLRVGTPCAFRGGDRSGHRSGNPRGVARFHPGDG